MTLSNLTAEAKVVLDGLTLHREATLKSLDELYSQRHDRTSLVLILGQVSRLDPTLKDLCKEMVTAIATWSEQPLETRYAIIQFISDTVEEQDTLAGRPNPDNEH